MENLAAVKLQRCILKLVFLCLLTLSSASSFADQIALTAFNYPPYMDKSVPSKGLYCELVEEAYKASGHKVSFQFLPLARSTLYVQRGEALGQLGTEWNFPAQARENDLISVPLFYYRVVGFYLKSQHRYQKIEFSSLSDLRGYKIDVIRGSSDAQILNTAKDLMIEEITTGEQVLRRLHSYRSDIGFMVELTGLSLIERLYPDEKEQWNMTEDAVQGILAQVVFSKHYPDSGKYAEALRRGVEIIRANGVYHQVLEKYYGKGNVPEVVSDISRSLYIIPTE